MKDLIIKGTGDSRFMRSNIPENITHEQMVELLREGEFPFDLAGLNPDGIEQMGTPYCVQTVLEDKTSEALGMDPVDDPTPNDAFKVTARNLPKVGDVKITRRTDLGDKWLLCNGSKIYTHKYPGLYEIFGSPETEYETYTLWNDVGSNANDHCLEGIEYIDGYYVAYGSRYNGSTYYAKIAWATSLSGGWTSRDLYSSSSPCYISGVAFHNGTWVLCGVYNGNSLYLSYSTSLSGTWTNHLSGSYDSRYNAKPSITCHDGVFIVAASTSSAYGTIRYTSDPSGTWTSKIIWDGLASSIEKVKYIQGHFVVCGNRNNASGVLEWGSIAYASSLDGPWNTVDILDNGGVSFHQYLADITYGDGKFAVCGHGLVDGKSNTTLVAYAASLSGDWTVAPQLVDSSITASEIRSIIYAEGYWVFTGKYKVSNTTTNIIGYSNSNEEPFTLKSISKASIYNQAGINAVIYVNYSWIFAEQYFSSTMRARLLYSKFPDGALFSLPSISLNNVYTYIKAKE